MHFGQRIKKLRVESGLSQAKLAEKTGIAKTTVSSWETGDTQSIDGDNLVSIARELNSTPEYIMTGKNPPSANDLSADELELVTIYRNMSEEDRVHYKAVGRAIKQHKEVPPPPLFQDQD